MKTHNRKLITDDEPTTTQSPFLADSPLPLLQPTNATTFRKPFKPNTPFDSSMALTVLVLLTALFFMGFFSVYIRRFADESPVDIARRRRHHHPQGGQPSTSSSSSSSFTPSRFTSRKGLDSSAVRSLPVFSYGGDVKLPMDCPVCLSEFEEKETVKMIPYCKHVFHQACIDTWLSSHVSCPVCRTTRLFSVEEKKCFVVVEGGFDQPVSESEGRSTVESGDTCTLSIRRTSSCSSLVGERGNLHRTWSF
ncbi:hypothetical protein L1049_013225 [Liquidambar formosana]|uniref:RING-type E3 ubiquitin transferase n=1 Tax=Liquidambar formosana TaxID=63359 RepID=A0AAP0RJZ4_LIQFO